MPRIMSLTPIQCLAAFLLILAGGCADREAAETAGGSAAPAADASPSQTTRDGERNSRSAPEAGNREAVKPAGDGIAGEWIELEEWIAGSKKRNVPPHKWTFASDGKLEVHDENGKPLTQGKYATDADQDPHHVDLKLTFSGKAETMPAIYSVEKDQLKIFYAHPGEMRPTAFPSDPSQTTRTTKFMRFRRADAEGR